MRFIAFIDLVGTKDIAYFDPEEYFKAAHSFQTSILQVSIKYENQGIMAYCFSDCAFIESENLIPLIEFIQELRNWLYWEGYYFKGAISTGTLGAIDGSEDFNEIERNHGKEIARMYRTKSALFTKAKNVCRGTFFLSSDVSFVYSLQDTLKGIGVITEPKTIELLPPESQEKYFVKSFYVPDIKKKIPVHFYDIRLTDKITQVLAKDDRPYEFPSSLTLLFEKYDTSNRNSSINGRYYLSVLATWLASTSYQNIRIENGFLKDGPSIFKAFWQYGKDINGLNFSKLFKAPPCFDYLYLFLLNCLYTSRRTTDNTTGSVLKRFASNSILISKYQGRFKEIPDVILSRFAKSCFQRDYNNYLYSIPQNDKGEESY